jgi:hypothetical protein
MKRLVACSVVVVGTVFAFAMTLGACGDSCVDTGCVEDTGPDVKEAGKKDAAKDAADASSDVTTSDANDAGDAGDAGDSGDAADTSTD